MTALRFSIVASIVLTVVCNVAIRAFPGIGEWVHDRMSRLAERASNSPRDETHPTGVRFFFPWKSMLIASVTLTLAINLLVLVLR